MTVNEGFKDEPVSADMSLLQSGIPEPEDLAAEYFKALKDAADAIKNGTPTPPES
jgi:hypothetical protein